MLEDKVTPRQFINKYLTHDHNVKRTGKEETKKTQKIEKLFELGKIISNDNMHYSPQQTNMMMKIMAKNNKYLKNNFSNDHLPYSTLVGWFPNHCFQLRCHSPDQVDTYHAQHFPRQ